MRLLFVFLIVLLLLGCGSQKGPVEFVSPQEVFLSQGAPKYPPAPVPEKKVEETKPAAPESLPPAVADVKSESEFIQVIIVPEPKEDLQSPPKPPKKAKKKVRKQRQCSRQVTYYEYQYYSGCNCYQYVPVQYTYYYPCGGRW